MISIQAQEALLDLQVLLEHAGLSDVATDYAEECLNTIGVALNVRRRMLGLAPKVRPKLREAA